MVRHGKTNERILSPRKIYASDLGIRNLFTGFRDIGALFENYVFLKIRKLGPAYLYEDRTEIDFVIRDQVLIEAKYQNAQMNKKQQDLFNRYPARQKFVVRNYRDIERMMQELKTKTSA